MLQLLGNASKLENSHTYLDHGSNSRKTFFFTMKHSCPGNNKRIANLVSVNNKKNLLIQFQEITKRSCPSLIPSNHTKSRLATRIRRARPLKSGLSKKTVAVLERLQDPVSNF